MTEQLDLFFEEELLNNQCKITFWCKEDINQKCCYNYKENCSYQSSDFCHSTVAQVNRLTLELQRLTGKKVRLE